MPQSFKSLRILHFMSPVRFDKSGLYRSDVCSNFKVVDKILKMLTLCHHYLLVPEKHNIESANNVTFLTYNYPRSVLLNRADFDHRSINLKLSNTDVDFVFNHQGENMFGLKSYFDSQRYNWAVGFFNFFQWIDSPKSRAEASPPAFARQWDAFIHGDYNLVHSLVTMDYFKSNFTKLNCQIDWSDIDSKIVEMPLSSPNDVDVEPFDLPTGKIVVFNHRWNGTTGINRLRKYIDKGIFNDYILWFTDEKCDLKGDNIIVKGLQRKQYNYLLCNCYASICFVDGFAVWNLSAQDSIKFNCPTLIYKHPVMEKIVGKDYPHFFTKPAEFKEKLDNIQKNQFKVARL